MRLIPNNKRWMLVIVPQLALLLALLCGGMPATAQESTPPQSTMADVSANPSVLETLQNPQLSHEEIKILLVPLTAHQLETAADTWRGYLQAKLADVARLNMEVRKTDDSATTGSTEQPPVSKASARAKLPAIIDERRALARKYRQVLAAWKEKGADAEKFKEHQAYLRATAKGTFLTTDPLTLIRQFGRWMVAADGGARALLQLGGFVIAVWALFLLARFSRRMADRPLSRIPSMSKILRSFLLTVVYWLTFVIGVMVVLAFLGVNITPLFAVFGGVSFILGFALQQTIGNFASGLMMTVLKPFDTGDYVQVAGTSGVVDEMSIVSTRIRTADNQIVTIPNSIIWGDVITNVSASETRRVDLVFGIDYSDSTSHAIQVLEDILAASPLCLKDPPPEVFVGELADSSVNIYCRPWVKREDYWTVYWGVTGAAKERFDAEGISIPFPQQDVHFISKQSAGS